MSGTFDDKGALVIADGRLISCFGKKKSGKSVLAKMLFLSYPDDKIVIDIAGDDGPNGDDILELTGNTAATMPRSWPESARDGKKPMTLRYVPDGESPTLLEDMGAVLSLAKIHGNKRRAQGGMGCGVLIHEIGVIGEAHKTPRQLRSLLMHNRHNAVTLFMCGPRTQTIDPLIIAQSDVVYIFELMNPDDRKRLAQSIGWDTDSLTQAIEGLGPHEYLRFDSNEMKPMHGEDDLRLVHYPALPESAVRKVLKA